MPATKADLDNLAAAIQAHDADPWFLALFHAALDATHDAAHALKVASAAYGQHPAQPVGPTGPKAPEAGRFDDGGGEGGSDAVSILTGPVRRLDDPQRFAEENDAVDLDAEEARLLRRLRRVQEARQDERTARLFREMPPPVVHVNVPAPVVNLPAPVVNVAAPPPVQVNVPAPVVNVAAPPVPRPPKGRVVKFVERDAEGNIVRLVEETE